MGGDLDLVAGAELLRDLVELGRGARRQVQVAAFRRQRLRDREPDAFRSAGDQGAAAAQIQSPTLAPVRAAVTAWAA